MAFSIVIVSFNTQCYVAEQFIWIHRPKRKPAKSRQIKPQKITTIIKISTDKEEEGKKHTHSAVSTKKSENGETNNLSAHTVQTNVHTLTRQRERSTRERAKCVGCVLFTLIYIIFSLFSALLFAVAAISTYFMCVSVSVVWIFLCFFRLYNFYLLDHDAYDRQKFDFFLSFLCCWGAWSMRACALESAFSEFFSCSLLLLLMIMVMMMLLFWFSFSFDSNRFWGTQYSRFYYCVYLVVFVSFHFDFCCGISVTLSTHTHTRNPFIRLLLLRFTTLCCYAVMGWLWLCVKENKIKCAFKCI